LGARLWRASWRFLAACLALWLGVRLLREIWWELAIVGVIVAGAAILLHWWRSRRW
jgi:hypothetical protein